MKVRFTSHCMLVFLLSLESLQLSCKHRNFTPKPHSQITDSEQSFVSLIVKENGSGRHFWIGQAERVVAEIAKMHQARIVKSGFKSREEFRRAMIDFDVTSRTALQHLESGDFDIAIHAHSDFRESIASRGFLSSRQVEHQRVNSEPEGLDRIENRLSFNDLAYVDLNPNVQPKYGLLRSGRKTSDIKPLITSYGDDVWILRKSKVADRTTWVAGDSFSFKGTTGSWEDIYAPWSSIMMAAPFLRTVLASYEEVVDADGTRYQRKVPGSLRISHPPEGMRYFPVGEPARALRVGQKITSNAFLELQVWGPIDLEDIESFEFTKKPPTRDFALKLAKTDIEIYDGRTWPAVVGKPESHE